MTIASDDLRQKMGEMNRIILAGMMALSLGAIVVIPFAPFADRWLEAWRVREATLADNRAYDREQALKPHVSGSLLMDPEVDPYEAAVALACTGTPRYPVNKRVCAEAEQAWSEDMIRRDRRDRGL